MAATLRRELGLFSTTMLIVGAMVGSGIFFGPQAIAAELPGAAPFLLVWLVAGVLSLLGALSVAELGAAMPQSGGPYVYVREAYGRLVAFLYGWGALLAGKTAALAAVAVVFGTFLHLAVPSPLGPPGYAVGLIAVLTGINALGVRQTALVQNVSTLLKVGGLVAVVGVGLLAGQRAAGWEPLFPPGGLGQGGLIAAFGVALVPALFAYDGWYFSAQVAEEVKDPARNLPRSIVFGTLAVMALYMVVNAVYVGVLGPQGLAAVESAGTTTVAGRHSPAIAVADLVLGGGGVGLVVAAVLASTFGTANAITLTGSRIYFAMARDGLFFPQFAGIHPVHATPTLAIVLQGALAMVLAASGTFLQLITVEVFGTWLFAGASVAAVITLRRSRPAMPRPYRCPGYPWVPLAFLAMSVVFFAATVVREPLLTGAYLGLLALGVPLYLRLERRAQRGTREVILADASRR